MSKPRVTGRQRMLAALKLQAVDRPPVWFMRQAGRHLPEYRELRKQHSFLDVCRDEAVNLQVSSEPWRRYGVDGAIVFNDILTPLIDMGMEVDFVPGPRFGRLIGSAADVDGLKRPTFDERTDVSRCIAALRACVLEDAAVLGFIGAPMTVAGFAIGGSGVQKRAPLASLMKDDPALFEKMQSALVPVLVDYARAQVAAGADVIQVFESLAADLSPDEYRRHGMPWFIATMEGIAAACPGVPIIAFGRGLWPFVGELASTPAAALSLDHTGNLWQAREVLRSKGSRKALQGNLSPEVLREEPLVAGGAAGALLSRWRDIIPMPERAYELGPTGWVFNLGHGVPADADPMTVEGVIAVLKEFDFLPVDVPEGAAR